MRKVTLLMGLLLACNASAVVCDVSTTAVNFGSYNVYATSNPGTQGQVTVSCTPLTTYTIALNGGLYGNISQRKMHSTTNSETMLYNLYTDASLSSLWGDGTSNGTTVTSSEATPVTVYAAIPPLQDVSVGTYTDNVSVTVSF
jgi:spore coat protein U-like protein